MGRKKRNIEDDAPEDIKSSKKKVDSSDEEYYKAPRHYDIDPDIQELAYTFGIDDGLTQRLNDIMIEERQRTWEQDLKRLYEILKDAHTPAALLNIKVKDMENGTFVGKAKCGPKVVEMVKKHRLDKGAATKLEEAMSMREAMGKDVDKDLKFLDAHLAASNKPSALVSMKLDSLRKGFPVGHCIYAREDPLPGNQAPGVDGVFDKRARRTLGYTDADLDKRFAEEASNSGGPGPLMDEATARRMINAERQQYEAQMESKARSRSRSIRQRRRKSRSHPRSASRSRNRRKSPIPAAKQSKSKSRSRKRGRRRSD